MSMIELEECYAEASELLRAYKAKMAEFRERLFEEWESGKTGPIEIRRRLGISTARLYQYRDEARKPRVEGSTRTRRKATANMQKYEEWRKGR